jgi:predicted nucleic acid-binding protein
MSDYLLDTNVLLRAIHDSAPEHPVAVSSITSLLARGESLWLVPQVLVELWSVTTRPVAVNGLGWDTQQVEQEITQLLSQFPLLPETPSVFQHWRQLVNFYDVRGRQVHDTRLVAIMQAHGVLHLLTFNVADFRRYQGITPVHPTDVPT